MLNFTEIQKINQETNRPVSDLIVERLSRAELRELLQFLQELPNNEISKKWRQAARAALYKDIVINSRQVRYCGTDYIVTNIPDDLTDEEILDACQAGLTFGFWISGFQRVGNRATFNLYYD